MIDLRTHLISLVAVFLALGIGILVGIDMIGGRAVISQERGMITRLQSDFHNLQTSEATLHTQLTVQGAQLTVANQFATDAVPYMVSGKLTGTTVAIVTTSAHVGSAPVVTVLRQAGATLGPVLSLDPEPAANSAVWADAGAILNVPASPQAVYAALARQIGASFHSGNMAPLVQLEALDLFKISGTLTAPAGGVVLIAGSPTASDPLAGLLGVPLVRMLKSDRLPAVAGQWSTVSAQYSTIPLFQGLGITTVDDIDLAAGQVSTVWGLTGTVGNYGLLPTAQALMPIATTP